VRRGLELLAPPGHRIAAVEVRRRDLRFPVPRTLSRRLVGQRIVAYRRWGKYLLIDTDELVLLSHLGMSGSWRACPPGTERRHDHLYLSLHDGRRLAYHDPRRFGFVDLFVPGVEAQHPRLSGLGPDALDRRAFDAAHLRSRLLGRRAPIKVALLDQ